MRPLLVLAAGSIAWSAAAVAQQPGPVRETAEVSLVEVTVRVAGKDGLPIRDLKVSDFALFDDGRKQEIVGFDAIDLAERVPRQDGSPIPPAARRRFLILFDFSFAQPKTIVAARRAARQLVMEGLEDRDLCAVATYSVETGVRFLVTFSSDRAQLVRAIDTLGLEAQREKSDPLAFAYDTSARRTVPDRSISGAGGEANSSIRAAESSVMVDSLQAMASIARARNDDYERGRVRSLIQSFAELGRALDAVEGRKDIVYLSEGFRNRFVVGTEETAEEHQWLIEGEAWKVDADKRFGNTPLREQLTEMGELFRRTDCVIHAVDIAGIAAETDYEGNYAIGHREQQESLYDLANPTGGEVFRNANDLSEQLRSLLTRTSLAYVLAFKPDRTGHEGRYHELKVKVSAPGARVAARKGYFERRGFKTLSPLERSLSAADVIASEIPMADIPIRVLAAPFAGAAEVASVPVLLEIPGGPLLAGENGERTGLEVYVYANDAENRLADYFVQSLKMDLASGRERLQAGGLRYYGALALPPGEYRLRALVRSADTGRMGFSVGSLRVPDFSKREPYVLAPVFLESMGSWTLVRGRGAAAGTGAETPAPLFAGLAGANATPSALPRLSAGEPSRLCLVAYHFGSGPDDAFKIAAQLLDGKGLPLPGGELQIVGKSPAEPDGRRVFLLSFTPPAGLSPGRYGLRVFLEDAATGQARQASTPFTIS